MVSLSYLSSQDDILLRCPQMFIRAGNSLSKVSLKTSSGGNFPPLIRKYNKSDNETKNNLLLCHLKHILFPIYCRGVAVEDPSSPNKLHLLIKDYPYAVDGLAVWTAIEAWVYEYCSIYYPDDSTVQADTELQAWWKEIRGVGHGDLKDETWWPAMKTCKELADTCTTMIWITSALHAAVNFGQYPYGGYHPNRPTISRRPMPEPGTKQYEELKQEPDRVFLKTITCQYATILVSCIIEILSRHSSDEVYLGQRDSEEWTSDRKALDAFNRFSQALVEIEKRIKHMNADPLLKNRNGLAKMPYMLLYPNTSDRSCKGTGIVGMGIPNSVSI
jgi:linoleate 9S-lipoxygenase